MKCLEIKSSIDCLSSRPDRIKRKLVNWNMSLKKLSRIKHIKNRNEFTSGITSVKPQNIRERLNTVKAIRNGGESSDYLQRYKAKSEKTMEYLKNILILRLWR